MFKWHFLLAQMRWAIHRSEAATLPMFLNPSQRSLLFTSVSLKPALVLDILDDRAGQEGDRLVHPGPAQRAVGQGALVAGGTDQVAVGTAEHWARGGPLQADWTSHPLLQLVH